MRTKLLWPVVLLGCLILLAGCSDNTPQQGVETWVLEQEKVITFSDGESLDLWHNQIGDACYKLSDGTELLTIRTPIGPDNVYVAGVESLEDLTEPAQNSIREFYEEQGLLYDTHAELEKAYEEYLRRENGEVYPERYISQDIVPVASNDKIMCFLTTVILPVEGQIAQEIRLGATFDRETGEVMSNWNLFTLPEEEARQWLLEAFNVDSSLRREMEAALKPEYIVLFPESLEVTFPRGTLPSQDYSYSVGLDYEELRKVLQPWAIPDNN